MAGDGRGLRRCGPGRGGLSGSVRGGAGGHRGGGETLPADGNWSHKKLAELFHVNVRTRSPVMPSSNVKVYRNWLNNLRMRRLVADYGANRVVTHQDVGESRRTAGAFLQLAREFA